MASWVKWECWVIALTALALITSALPTGLRCRISSNTSTRLRLCVSLSPCLPVRVCGSHCVCLRLMLCLILSHIVSRSVCLSVFDTRLYCVLPSVSLCDHSCLLLCTASACVSHPVSLCLTPCFPVSHTLFPCVSRKTIIERES